MSAAILTLVPKEKTPEGREQLSRAEPGRPRGSITGSYLSDLAALKKAILLTPDEARIFQCSNMAKDNGYQVPKGGDDFTMCTGYSDASKERLNQNGILFLPKGN